MNQPNWVFTTIVGAILGFLLPYLLKAFVFFALWFKRDRLEGKWYAYHTMGENGERKVVSALWTIRRGYKSRFIISESRGNHKKAMYKGALYFERNFWLVILQATGHREKVLVRFFNPLTTQDNKTWGLYLGIDNLGRPVAGPLMLSRRELSRSDALSYLSSKISIDSKYRLITG